MRQRELCEKFRCSSNIARTVAGLRSGDWDAALIGEIVSTFGVVAADATQRKWGWTYFLTGVVGVVAWAVAVGAERDPSDTSGLWLSAGLGLLLAAFVLEPWYSGSGTSIANSLLVGAGVVAAGFEAYIGWWVFLLVVSGVAFRCCAAF